MAKKKVSSFVFHRELIQQMLTLSTSAFGLAAALAWNEAIQQIVKDFIAPSLPGSVILSKLIYALLVTLLAVLITFQLSKMAQKWGLKK